MNTFKRTVAVIAAAATLGAATLTATSASAKFLPSTHFSGGRTNPGAVQGNTFTPGVPGGFGNNAPSFPSGGSPPPPPPPPPGVCGTHPGQCG
ncbi:MAG: hypothetical protein JO163_21550 [Methylobacteriaceae bacterium]|nr:hypothetical protein [Methylobacteriaceae bacterium]MBV9705318.1 hypothetical protein [Methylobacteriaceae bacterium]